MFSFFPGDNKAMKFRLPRGIVLEAGSLALMLAAWENLWGGPSDQARWKGID